MFCTWLLLSVCVCVDAVKTVAICSSDSRLLLLSQLLFPLQPPKVTRNAQQQLALLQQRCSEYRSAAIRHRDAGEREEALRLLKYVKDLQAHIDLSKQGMPVDETAIPPPLHEGAGGAGSLPRLSAPSKPVKASDGDDDTFQLIEDQIQKQIDFCEENANVYEKSGNRPGASRFRNMAEDCKQELLAIKGIHSQGLAPPRFTMEMRTVSLLHGFPDLGSSECEVEVIKLVDAPKDQTIYVEVEFPYPSDDAPKDQTQKTKDEVCVCVRVCTCVCLHVRMTFPP